MSVDPNKYDLDELRELADEEPTEEVPSESDFLWMGDGDRSGTPRGDAPPADPDSPSVEADSPSVDASSPDASASDASAPDEGVVDRDRDDPVLASAVLGSPESEPAGTDDPDDTGWLDVPAADETSRSD